MKNKSSAAKPPKNILGLILKIMNFQMSIKAFMGNLGAGRKSGGGALPHCPNLATSLGHQTVSTLCSGKKTTVFNSDLGLKPNSTRAINFSFSHLHNVV